MGRFKFSCNVEFTFGVLLLLESMFPLFFVSVFCHFYARLFQNTEKYLYLGSRIAFTTIQTPQNTQNRLKVNSKLLEIRYLTTLNQFLQVIDTYFKDNNYRSSCCPKSNSASQTLRIGHSK